MIYCMSIVIRDMYSLRKIKRNGIIYLMMYGFREKSMRYIFKIRPLMIVVLKDMPILRWLV